jgi:uncharacterized protein (UPF0332 family)
MTLATDLLEQARHLASREKKKPRQASLRRAISTAYYSLFHLLLEAGSRQFVVDVSLRRLVSRAFSHGEMQKAAKCFASGGDLPAHLSSAFSGSIPAEIQRIALAFVDLQQARHDADYNLLERFTRAQVERLIQQAAEAVTDWRTNKGNTAARPAVELFLSSLLLWERWRK